MSDQPKPSFPATSAESTRFIQQSHQLQQYGLVNFMHDITFGKGQISMLVGSDEVFRFYRDNKIPMLCTNDQGRTLPAGLYVNGILQEQYQDCAILMPLLVKVGKQFGSNFGKNSLHLVEREPDCQHLYSVFFDLPELDFLHLVINNGNFLQDYIANYKLAARDFIQEIKLPANRIELPNFSDLYTTEQKNESITEMVFHKTSNLPIALSQQQSRCLRLLMQGKSAKEIGKELKLSYRTVEHYLEKIRKTLGCKSNKDLIVSYADQIDKKR